MDTRVLLILLLTVVVTSAWSPYYSGPRRPMRFTRFAPSPPHAGPPVPHLAPLIHQRPRPPHNIPAEKPDLEKQQWDRPKRGHDYDHDHDHDHDHRGTSGVTGPVHTFVKTDKNANYKWGVRHHVGDKYAS